jgi:DNA-binding NtrC family response regulator
MNILLVDDDRVIRLVAEALIDKTGRHNILSCGDIDSANRIIHGQTKIDGAILDLVLRDGTGLSIAKECELHNIPVVFCTSTKDAHNTSIMYEYGWIIDKPVCLEAINRVITYFKSLNTR